MSELSYENENGDTVYTSQYFRNRGTCCRTNCLHCPFGTTLKNLGLSLVDLSDSDIDELSYLVNKKDALSSSLLGSAFGNQKSIELNSNTSSKFKKIIIKDTVAGLVHVENLQVKKLYLKHHFSDQGLDKATVGAYL